MAAKLSPEAEAIHRFILHALASQPSIAKDTIRANFMRYPVLTIKQGLEQLEREGLIVLLDDAYARATNAPAPPDPPAAGTTTPPPVRPPAPRKLDLPEIVEDAIPAMTEEELQHLDEIVGEARQDEEAGARFIAIVVEIERDKLYRHTHATIGDFLRDTFPLFYKAGRRQWIEAQLIERPQLSDRQVAAPVGASHHTVAKVREQLESTGQIAHSPRRTGSDGRVRKTGSSSKPPIEPPPPPVPTTRGLEHHPDPRVLQALAFCEACETIGTLGRMLREDLGRGEPVPDLTELTTRAQRILQACADPLGATREETASCERAV